MSELDEKVDRTPSSPTTTADESELESHPSRGFAPINLAANSRSNSHARSQSRSRRPLSRSRSNNGYGCDDHADSAEEESGDPEASGAPEEKDPFEVHWDGGDSDPMNPRSMSLGRKWAIVLIVSASSLCV